MTTTRFQTPSEFPGITYGGDDWRAARLVYRLHTILGRVPATMSPQCDDCGGSGTRNFDDVCIPCGGSGWVSLSTRDVEETLTMDAAAFLHHVCNGDDSTVGGLLALLDVVHTWAANQ